MSKDLLISESIVDTDGVEHLLLISKPVFESNRDWHCIVSFTPRIVDRRVFGATSIQAVFLSLHLLAAEYDFLADQGLVDRGSGLLGPTP